jgi:iron(III) transport system ATP-binding protein
VSAAPLAAATGAPDAAPLLAVEALHCRLGGQDVVQGASLALAAGDLGCLLGPSGCGKTTLLRAIAGFQPVASGEVRLRGRVVASSGRALPPEARGVGLVFQDLALFPHLDVAGNVGFGLTRLERSEREARVRETLQLLDLQDLAGRYPHELSGGQQQRTAIARAIAPRPQLLLLDEPFSSLDADLRRQIRGQIRALLKRLGITALLVTHDQEEAFAFADRIGVMRAGKLLQWASAFDTYHRPASAFVARFVGEGRLIPGRVLPDGRIETELGRFRGQLPEQASSAGAAVQVLLRPDDIQPGNGGDLMTEVVDADFRGAETLYRLRLAGGSEVCALFPSHHRHAPGDRLAVALDMEHVVVFPAEPA